VDVRCPACAARYVTDDEKLRGKTARMRCKACNTVWLVSGPNAESSGPSVHAPPLSSGNPASTPPPAAQTTGRRAAVVKRGTEREQRDLFATRNEEVPAGFKESLPPPSFGFTGVGARNETSVLFRVDQLTRPMPRIQSTPPPDDEGVIDLKALSSAPPPPMRAPVAPLFSEPPPVTMEVGRTGQHPATVPLRLIAAVAGALAVLAVVGLMIAVAFKGEDPKPAAAVAPPPPPPPPAPVVSTATPAPLPASSSEVASEDEAKATKKKSRKRAVITNKTPAPAPKPVAKADPCGCHGDFQCILACTAKGK
jgi:predicted Zn finger-like uncharacterized protein